MAIKSVKQFKRQQLTAALLFTGILWAGITHANIPSEDGSSSVTTAASEIEQSVMKRAQERWGRVLEEGIEAGYEYTSPAYRSRTPLQRFRAQFGQALRWEDAEVVSARCEADRCRVDVDMTYTLPREGISHTRLITETWILADDEWWIRARR